MPKATVLIPTFNHGPTLLRSARSALEQTVSDLELFIVGDGVPEVTRDVVAELIRSDSRVRFFDHPKGPRNGESYRHAVLGHAQSPIVCYLCDDDLWLPDHLATMRLLLQEADFAHTLPLFIEADGALGGVWPVDLALPEDRALLLSGINRVPLSCAGHTMRFYRQLPYGWRTTPPGLPTDLYMFQQFLAAPGCRAVSGYRPTMLHFPSPDRPHTTIAERVDELDRWTPRLSDPAWREVFVSEILAFVVRDRARHVVELRTRDGELAALQGTLEERDRQIRELEAALQAIDRSRIWRLRRRLLELPPLGPGAKPFE